MQARGLRDDNRVHGGYIGRIAPSPTGLLHAGHAATFVTAWERAQTEGGRVLLRIDDLDLQRSKEQFVEAAREDLAWLGITWSHEVRESQRLPWYQHAAERLLAEGQVYACTCSRKDLQQAVGAPHEDSDDEPLYNGRCRPILAPSDACLQPGTNYRFRVPDTENVEFVDGNFGLQCFRAGVDFGDFLVWRKDGLPSYQLACVVDDMEDQITEVVRGRDLLKSTARQILLQRALGYGTPAYFHTELLRDDAGQRLAKRHDALSLRYLRGAGVTPAALRADLGARFAAGRHHKR